MAFLQKHKYMAMVLVLIAVVGFTPALRVRATALFHITRLWLKPLPTNNSLNNPVPKHPFIDTWGAPRGNGRKHEGVDIFAKRGTPVVSNTDAVVIKIGNNRIGGQSVSLWGAGGLVHYHTHLHDYGDIALYQYLPKGTVIGYVGNTGNAKTTPPHLHYGIYTANGKAINPYPLLKKKS